VNDAEKHLDELEASFPPLAKVAFGRAREEALAAGLSVLESRNGVIYEVFPDGRRIARKQIEPPVNVEKGAKFRLR